MDAIGTVEREKVWTSWCGGSTLFVAPSPKKLSRACEDMVLKDMAMVSRVRRRLLALMSMASLSCACRPAARTTGVDTIRELRPNVPLSGSIVSGVRQSFTVRFDRAQYARVVLEQGDFDLAVTIVDANNHVFGEADTQARGAETFSVVADHSGT